MRIHRTISALVGRLITLLSRAANTASHARPVDTCVGERAKQAVVTRHRDIGVLALVGDAGIYRADVVVIALSVARALDATIVKFVACLVLRTRIAEADAGATDASVGSCAEQPVIARGVVHHALAIAVGAANFVGTRVVVCGTIGRCAAKGASIQSLVTKKTVWTRGGTTVAHPLRASIVDCAKKAVVAGKGIGRMDAKGVLTLIDRAYVFVVALGIAYASTTIRTGCTVLPSLTSKHFQTTLPVHFAQTRRTGTAATRVDRKLLYNHGDWNQVARSQGVVPDTCAVDYQWRVGHSLGTNRIFAPCTFPNGVNKCGCIACRVGRELKGRRQWKRRNRNKTARAIGGRKEPGPSCKVRRTAKAAVWSRKDVRGTRNRQWSFGS